MKVSLTLSVEDALQLQRFLYDLRHALSVNAACMQWVIPGVPGPSYNISQIVLMEDLQSQLSEAADDAVDQIHFAGCCRVY